MAVDPIFMMGPILTALNGIVSRRINPLEPAVVTIGLVQGGTVANVIPNHVDLEITLRSSSPEARQQLLQEVEAALSIARNLGGDYEMHIVPGYPALYNDPTVTGWLRDTASSLIGPDNVLEGELGMYGEDFAFMAQASRGAMISLGSKDPNGPPRFHHHPEFDVDDNCLPYGAAILAETAMRFIRGAFK
jgi:amidohydrolase